MATQGTIRETVRVPVEELGAHLATLEEELSGGRSIEVVRGETVIAEVRAPDEKDAAVETAPVMPDFMGRMKAVWGDHVFPEGYGTRLVREDRDGRE